MTTAGQRKPAMSYCHTSKSLEGSQHGTQHGTQLKLARVLYIAREAKHTTEEGKTVPVMNA